MRIISFNNNCFGGREYCRTEYYIKKKFRQWDGIDKAVPLRGLMDIVKKDGPDVVFLQEFDINDQVWADSFLHFMKNENYSLYPKGEYAGRPSLTVCFVKKEWEPYTEELANPHARDGHACVLKVKDVILYGVHVPKDKNFLNEMIVFMHAHKQEKVLLIGDLNINRAKPVYANTIAFEAMLKDIGAKDVWLEKHAEGDISKTNQMPTYKAGRRIDYSVASESLYPYIIKAEIWKGAVENNISDHEPIFLTIGDEGVSLFDEFDDG